MPTHNDHNPMQDKLLDLIRGELDPAETVRLQTLLASDPALRARRASLEAFLAAAKQAHALPEDPDAGTRVAARILDSQDKVADKAKAIRLSEVLDTLQGAIWSELKTGQDISGMRRNLQRDYLRRVAGALVKPTATMPADVGALHRQNAVELQQRIRAALAKGGMSTEAKAHLSESLNTLTEALKAPLARNAV